MSSSPKATAATHALIVLAPLGTIFLLIGYLNHHDFALDFRREYWVAAHRLLLGHNPYLWTRAQIAGGTAFPYPATTAILLAPFGLLSRGLSAALFVALSMAAVILTLRVLSVRDYRVYLLAFLWFPVINAWQSGNLTLLLGLVIALAWRYRSRPAVAGCLAALAISLKPFVWPLGLWLLATRRYRAAAWALGAGAMLNLVAFAVLGFDDIGRYLHLSSEVTNTLYRSGYSVVAIVLRVGIDRGLATVAMVLLAIALAALCVWLGRAHRDEAALTVSVVLMLVASPLLWNHYFALLIVPVAIAHPRLSREWLVPLAMWVCPALHVTEWQALTAALVTGWLTYRLVNAAPAQGPDRDSLPALRKRWADKPHLLPRTQGAERVS